MSERKVLNKYYPPDFDPSKIPRAKCPKNRQFTVRLMAPCNMKCLTCGEYIAKAKKFNARKEDVENQNYLGIRIYRFYIKCPGCLAEISFRTDPESTDYVIEAGAHRNFQALKLAEEQAEREDKEAREEIESNPMLLLENRTEQSQHEMEVLESLEDLRELNERHAGVDLENMTKRYDSERKLTKELQEEVERLAALKALGFEVIEGKLIKRLASDNNFDESEPKKIKTHMAVNKGNLQLNKREFGGFKSKLSGLVKVTGISKKSQEALEMSADKSSDANSEGLSSKQNCKVYSDEANKTLDYFSSKSNQGENSQYKNGIGCGSNNSISALSILGTYSDSDSNSEDGT